MSSIVTQLKEAGQDFEFYPTTNEIIAALVKDIRHLRVGVNHHDYRREYKSILDIGAGNGKVLKAVCEQDDNIHSAYAIEKSPILCGQLPASIFIVGTEFHEQSLISKSIDLTFCNPPYSEFEDWAVKIIRESSSHTVYLVIPDRWERSIEIAAALKYREAEHEVVGKFTFEHAEDRTARARVHLIRIKLGAEKEDAFDRFFDEQFADLKAKFKSSKPDEDDKPKDQRGKFADLVVGTNYPERLVALYNDEMDKIRKNYELVGKLDADLLKEFDVTPVRVLGCLKERMKGLRNEYWQELISNMSQVTDRLINKKRQQLLRTLNSNAHVDFTLSNIHAVVIWMLKNANQYVEEQLIEVFEEMVSKANVRNYKSNQRAFVYDRWRYKEEKPTHIALEYRLVLEHSGGMTADSFSSKNKLSERACECLGDILTVAHNLGFLCKTNDTRLDRWSRAQSWTGGVAETFEFTIADKLAVLLEVRAFYNGNMHIRMNQKFALALNVEYGRLKGWLKSGKEAAEELNDPAAPAYFGKNLQLGVHNLPMLGAPKPEEPPASAPEGDLVLKSA